MHQKVYLQTVSVNVIITQRIAHTHIHVLLFRAENVVGFECDFEECPEAAAEPKPECRNQYTINSCCATKTICDEAEVKSLHTCWYEGKDFHGGNLIYPPGSPCYKCLCDEKFDNSTAIPENKNCKPVDCGIEVHAMNNIQQGCVPVYFNDNYCCPVEFRCRKYFARSCQRLVFELTNFFLSFVIIYSTRGRRNFAWQGQIGRRF